MAVNRQATLMPLEGSIFLAKKRLLVITMVNLKNFQGRKLKGVAMYFRCDQHLKYTLPR